MKAVCVLLLVVVGCAQEENLGNTPFQDHATWSLALGGRGYEHGNAVAIDSLGDVLVGGNGYEGTIDFGNGPVGNLGSWAFVAKRSGDTGAAMWERAITGSEDGATVWLSDIALASDGSIYVTGSYMGTADFGGVSSATELHLNEDMFVAKYTSDGALSWAETLGYSSNASGQRLAVDTFDNVYVSGRYRVGTFTFLGTTYTSGDNQVGYVVSYTRDGAPRWLRSFDPTAQTSVSGISASPTGDVVFAGRLSSSTTFGGDVLQGTAQQAFLARYRSDGSYVWARSVGDPNATTTLNDVTVDSSDRIVVETASAEPPYDGNGEQSLATFGPDGKAESSYTVDKAAIAQAVMADGTLVSSQWIDSLYDVDHPELATGQLELTSIDSAGDIVTSDIGKRLTQAGQGTFVNRIAVGPTGELAVVGDLAGEILVGPTAITAHGTNDTDALVILIPAKN